MKKNKYIFTGKDIRKPTISIDDRVEHNKFGPGVATSVRISANSDYYYVEVEFDKSTGYPKDASPTKFRTIRDDYLSKIDIPILEVEGEPVTNGAK